MSEAAAWLLDRGRPGAEHMAIDAAALAAAEEGSRRGPFLRFYRFVPACISLGHHQERGVLDERAVAALGLDVVHRPTGGAAVLHDEELTWSIAAPRGGALGHGRDEIYGRIADGLVRALRALGVEASRAGTGRPQGAACFAAAGGHELVVGGRKLMGNAMRLTRGGFLVHGSLLTGPGHARLATCLREADAGARELGERCCHLGQGSIPRPADAAIAAAIVAELGGAGARRLDELPAGLT